MAHDHRRAPELPYVSARPFIADGGMETTLIFHRGLERPDFAAFVLLDDERDPAELADGYRRLPRLTVIGRCCGTDHRHVAAAAAAVKGV